MIDMIIAFVLSWICTLSGVALGGFLVFRTKRDSYEGLFQAQSLAGQAFNTDDGFGFDDPVKTKTELPTSILDATDRFTQQFAETLAKKAGEK